MCCRTVFCLLAQDSALAGPPGGHLALAGRLPAGKARLARWPQALDGGADVCKSLVKGPSPSTQLHDMVEPWHGAPQRRAAWPTLAALAGSSAAGASGPRQVVATNGAATAMTDSARLFCAGQLADAASWLGRLPAQETEPVSAGARWIGAAAAHCRSDGQVKGHACWVNNL